MQIQAYGNCPHCNKPVIIIMDMDDLQLTEREILTIDEIEELVEESKN